MLISLLFDNPIVFLMVAISILLALSLHEYFHAWTAYFLGDPTAKYEGRLTINPLAHLDVVGTIMLFVIGIGWGKPVPFNPYNLRNQRWGPALVALSGPLSNFLTAIVIGLCLRFFAIENSALLFFLGFFVWINLILGVFNLMPIPPLDGSHVLFTLLPERFFRYKLLLEQYGLFVLILFIFGGGSSIVFWGAKALYSLISGQAYAIL